MLVQRIRFVSVYGVYRAEDEYPDFSPPSAAESGAYNRKERAERDRHKAYLSRLRPVDTPDARCLAPAGPTVFMPELM